MPKIKNNESDMCKECGGRCCKSYAGAYHPDDFDPICDNDIIEMILHIDKREDLSIDWLEGGEFGTEDKFFIRPRHEGGDIVDPSYGERCIHLGPNGCVKPFDERPYACRALVPKKNINGACLSVSDGTTKLDKEIYAEWWEPFQSYLKESKIKFDKGTRTGLIDKEAVTELLRQFGLLGGKNDD